MRAFPAPDTGKESADSYGRVIARLNSRWRIIACRDGIQWILQQGKSSGHGTAWRGRSYCRTKIGLMRVCAHHVGDFDGDALAILEALPEWIGERP
jgi:hypothetical protein